MNRVATALVLFCLAASPARAATYFVSQQGNDANSCQSAQGATESNHKLTISSGVECLSAGDTLYIHGGTYTGSRNVIDSQRFNVPSGTSFWNAVTIAGYPGESVTLQPPYNVSGIRLTSGAPHYLILQDFAIDMGNSSWGAYAEGIFMNTAHHIRFERLDVRRSATFGVHFGPNTPANEMLNCRIYDNGTSGGGSSNGHGLYISSSDNVFDGNEVFNNYGYGFHIYSNWGPRSDPSNNIVRNNRIYGNGNYNTIAYGIVFAWGYGNVAHDNLIYFNAGGVQVYTQATATTIYHNYIYGNATEGIALQYYGSGIVISENLILDNHETIRDYGGFAESPVIANNQTLY